MVHIYLIAFGLILIIIKRIALITKILKFPLQSTLLIIIIVDNIYTYGMYLGLSNL